MCPDTQLTYTRPSIDLTLQPKLPSSIQTSFHLLDGLIKADSRTCGSVPRWSSL
jgi:hypothetical protein